MISQTISNWINIVGIATIVIPILVVIVWKLLFDGRIWTVFLGVVVYMIFGQLVLSFVNSSALSPEKFDITQPGSVAVYVIYMALITALCEEGGKFVLFKFVIKPCEDKEEALSVGIGHGGMAGIMVLGANCLMFNMVNKMFAAGDNASLLSLLGSQGAIDAYATKLAALSVGSLLLMLLEQVLMMAFNIFSTFFVFMSARKPEKSRVFIFMIVAHAIFVVPSVLNDRGIIPLWSTELILLVLVAVFAYFGIKEYKAYVNTHNYDPSKSRWNKNKVRKPEPKGPQKGGTKKKHK